MLRRLLLTLFTASILANTATAQITQSDSLAVTDSAFKDTVSQVNSYIDSVQTDTSTFLNPEEKLPVENKTSFTIKGQVKDVNNREGIPFATVFFLGTSIGTSADLDGNFEMILEEIPSDTLKATAIGFSPVTRPIQRDRILDVYNLEMQRGENTLTEFVFYAGEDPVITLIKNIIQNKPKNNPDKLDNYSYEVYNKLELDLEKLTKEQFEKLPLMKPFSFIFDNVDSFSDETPYLPFYLTESLSKYYYKTSPKKSREIVEAVQIKGLNNESMKQFLGTMYQNVNAYKNYILVMDKNYVSPISNSALFYYDFKMVDTQYAYGFPIIQVQFKPKRSGENTFFGDFWVVDSVYALQKITLQVPRAANINWVQNVSLFQEFAPVRDSMWFCIKDKFNAQFVAMYGAKFPGFIGRKTTTYKDIDFNQAYIDSVLEDKNLKTSVIVSDSSSLHGADFWEFRRHDTLTKNERSIYRMIDTLEGLPIFHKTKTLIKFLGAGVYDWGPIELGPWWYIYSNNAIEGNRFRISLGTNPNLFKNMYISGYGAYGTYDKMFKYKGSALWLLDRKPRMYLYGAYTKDYDRSTSYYDEVSSDNIFSVAVRKRNVPWKLALVEEARLEFYKEYFSGFSHQLTFLKSNFTPVTPLPSAGIFFDENGLPIDNVKRTELNLRLRFARGEKFLEGNYYRVSLGTKYPVAELRMSLGFKGLLGGQYAYQKSSVSISDNVKISPFGALYYNVFAGKYWGTLPYPLLEIHPGNDLHYYNKYAFNMMLRYEFLSDEYVGFNIENTLGGGIFNYIPILKKAKFRQFWTAKGLLGRLSPANRALNLNKGFQFKTLQGNPYLELGTGVENILQLFRIDFVWRVLPVPEKGEPRASRFGIFGSIKYGF